MRVRSPRIGRGGGGIRGEMLVAKTKRDLIRKGTGTGKRGEAKGTKTDGIERTQTMKGGQSPRSTPETGGGRQGAAISEEEKWRIASLEVGGATTR